MSEEELRQCVLDMQTWLEAHADAPGKAFAAAPPASEGALSSLPPAAPASLKVNFSPRELVLAGIVLPLCLASFCQILLVLPSRSTPLIDVHPPPAQSYTFDRWGSNDAYCLVVWWTCSPRCHRPILRHWHPDLHPPHQGLLGIHDGLLPLLDFTGLTCAQIASESQAAKASGKVSRKPPPPHTLCLPPLLSSSERLQSETSNLTSGTSYRLASNNLFSLAWRSGRTTIVLWQKTPTETS